VQVLSSALGVLVKIGTGSLGVIDGFPTAWKSSESVKGRREWEMGWEFLPLGAATSVGRAEATTARVAMVAAVNFMLMVVMSLVVVVGMCLCWFSVAGRIELMLLSS
jgi:hypothetical protein